MAVSSLKLDPSRTTTLQRQMQREASARYITFWRDLYSLIVVQDSFGLKKQRFVFNETWQFLTDDRKLEEFRKWFEKMVALRILSVDSKTAEPWTNKYVESAYRKAFVRSFSEVSRKRLLTTSSGFNAGAQAQFLRDAFSQPEQVSKLRLLATRTFEELKGITPQMGKELNRILSDAVAHGWGVNKAATAIKKRVSISRERAMKIARTEIIHAHAEGQLDSLEMLGVEEVGIEVEFTTAGAPCPICVGLRGIYTIQQARGIIPVHPQCQCSWTPVTRSRR